MDNGIRRQTQSTPRTEKSASEIRTFKSESPRIQSGKVNRKNPAKNGGVSFFIGDYINDSVRWQAFGGKRVVFLNKIRVGKIFRFLKKTVSLAAINSQKPRQNASSNHAEFWSMALNASVDDVLLCSFLRHLIRFAVNGDYNGVLSQK